MTAKDIQRRLLFEKFAASTVMPNFTPINWFECDVMEITKAGYFTEYEIKISRSDFKADALKNKRTGFRFDGATWVDVPGENKHKRLAQADPKGPSRFWFVVPVGLITLDEVPGWAGLVVAVPTGEHSRFRAHLRIEKEAPKLHRVKADPKIIEQMMKAGYYRFHRLLNRMPSQTQPS